MENSIHTPIASPTASAVKPDQVTRRGFLEIGAAALAVAGFAPAIRAAGAEQSDRSSSTPGPGNPALDAENADAASPPATDAGGYPTFKYPFAFANKRRYDGGWSREVTVRELAVSKAMAGVNMRLTAGGVRELHWHTAAEWAIMLYGSARITVLDAEGRSFVADVKQYDLWYFPSGMPHSLQGLGPDGAEFLLVFDDGNFSEFGTVLLSDTMRHAPPEVIAKNFGLAAGAFKDLPQKELFIFQAEVPGALAADQRAAAGALGASPQDFAFRTMDLPVTQRTKSGVYQDFSLSQWLAHTPPELVMAHLRIDRATYDAMPKDEVVVMPR